MSVSVPKKSVFPHWGIPLSFLLLLLTWFIPLGVDCWAFLDEKFFLTLNHALVGLEDLQHVIAWLNSRYADWCYEGFFLSLYIFAATQGKTKLWCWRLLSVVVCITLTQVFINKIIFFKLFAAERLSPSLIFEHPVDLLVFNYLNNKVSSSHSFPADHATTLFLCSFFVCFHFQKRVGVFFMMISFVMLLPRLFAGAHWLTDVIFGAGGIAIFSWWLWMASWRYFVEKEN